MVHSTRTVSIFNQAINDYHNTGELRPEPDNPYHQTTLEHLLYKKAWIDSVQWHLEDEVRARDIDAESGWSLKKEIDRYNQWRTDTVELIDTHLHEELKGIKHKPEAAMNSESPGWVLDRLSILALKINHMKTEAHRQEAGATHLLESHRKLQILLEQQEDLCSALDQLMEDLLSGRKYMKVYYQMKMYNDERLNPALYRKSDNS